MSAIIIIAIVAAAAVFCLGFTLIVINLVPALRQLRSVLVDVEKTSAEIRQLCQHYERVGDQLHDKIEKTDAILDSACKIMDGTGDTLQFISHNILKKSAAWLTFLPALRWGWKMAKKLKGGK